MKISKERSGRVQRQLLLGAKKQAELITPAVVLALEEVLANRFNEPGYSLKLGSFGKFIVHDRPGMVRTIPFTDETKQIAARTKVKFIALGRLRQLEKGLNNREAQYTSFCD